MMYSTYEPTLIAPLVLGSEDGTSLCACQFTSGRDAAKFCWDGAERSDQAPVFCQARSWLDRYFAGEAPDPHTALSRTARHDVPTGRLGGASHHPLRADGHLRLGGEARLGHARLQNVAARGRRRGGCQPHRHHRPLPSRRGRGRKPHGVWRGHQGQGGPSRARGRCPHGAHGPHTRHGALGARLSPAGPRRGARASWR